MKRLHTQINTFPLAIKGSTAPEVLDGVQVCGAVEPRTKPCGGAPHPAALHWNQAGTGSTENGHRTQNPELALPLTVLALTASLLSVSVPHESLWPLDASHCFLRSQCSTSTSPDFHDAHWKSPSVGVEELTDHLCRSPLTRGKLSWLKPLYISIHCKNPQLPGVNTFIQKFSSSTENIKEILRTHELTLSSNILKSALFNFSPLFNFLITNTGSSNLPPFSSDALHSLLYKHTSNTLEEQNRLSSS